MTGLDLNDVALFAQVVSAGSFAEAARRLGTPASTVSRRIQALEELLGARLMQRSTRKLALTEAGRLFHERTAAQLQAVLEAGEDVAGESALPNGTVRVAAPANFLDWFAADWVAEFLHSYPKVRIELVLSDATADLITEGIDVAFRSGVLPDSSLIARRVATLHPVLVASPDYLAAHGSPQTPHDLQHHECLTPPNAAGRATWRLQRAEKSGDAIETCVLDVTGRYRANTAQALAKAATAGLGVALLPSIVVGGLVETGRLAQVLPGWGLASVDFSIVYPSRRQQPRAVAVFIEFALAKLATSEVARLG